MATGRKVSISALLSMGTAYEQLSDPISSLPEGQLDNQSTDTCYSICIGPHESHN